MTDNGQDGQQPNPDSQPENTGDQAEQTVSMPQKAFTERLARAGRTAVTDFLKEVGFEKPDDFKAFITTARQREQSELSEAERLKQALEAEKQKSAQATEAAQKAEAKRLEMLVDSAIRTAAVSANAKNPDDVLLWARSQDLSDVLDEDGKVNAKSVSKIIDTLKKERAHWFGNGGSGTPGSPSNAGGTTTPPDKKLQDAMKRATRTTQRIIRG